MPLLTPCIRIQQTLVCVSFSSHLLSLLHPNARSHKAHNQGPRLSTTTDSTTYDRARNQILSVWSDRLQLVSVLVRLCLALRGPGSPLTRDQSTFFTSIDSLLFSLSTNQRDHTRLGQLMSAAFAGALVFHAAGGACRIPAAYLTYSQRHQPS
jgi:hypothetical protein